MTDSRAGDLVPVHGGGALVDRIVPLSRRARFLAEAESLPSLRVSRADLSTIHRIADGALSPLIGPMREEVYHRVLDERRILVGGRPYAWTIPLSLPVTDEEAARLARGGSAAVRDDEGRVVAILDDVEIVRRGTSRSTCSASTARIASTIRAGAWWSRTCARGSRAASCVRCRRSSIRSTAST